jgi:hypothetical protein
MQKKHFSSIIACLTLFIASAATGSASAPVSQCDDADKVCKNFEHLFEAQQPEKIAAQYEAAATTQFSESSLRYIGNAYLQLASRDNLSPEQEEGYYRKALEVKHYIAYMGLYFFYAQKNEEKALGFLREYVKTKPADTVPYVILGESELDMKHYELADAYLREGKQVAHAHSPRVDWLLFQANYLLKNYAYAKDMFASAVTKGKFEKEIRTIATDPRFEGIDKRPEFKEYQSMLKVEKTPS